MSVRRRNAGIATDNSTFASEKLKFISLIVLCAVYEFICLMRININSVIFASNKLINF